MKKSRFTESEIVGLLKEADAGLPVGDVTDPQARDQHHDLLQVEVQVRRSDASVLKRIKELEAQLSEFKQIVADLTLENEAMKGLIAKKL